MNIFSWRMIGLLAAMSVAALTPWEAALSAGKPSSFAFQPLAVKVTDRLPMNCTTGQPCKESVINAVVDTLIDTLEPMPDFEPAVGTNDLDRLTYREDDDADGTPEEVGKMLEVRFTSGPFADRLLLAVTGRHHAIALPLGIIGVLTRDVVVATEEKTEIQVYAAQPETYTRVFFRDVGLRRVLESVAAGAGNRLDAAVETALVGEGFLPCVGETDCPNMGKGPLLNGAVIRLMETMGRAFADDPTYTLADYAHVAPAIAVGTPPDVRAGELARFVAAYVDAGTRGDIGENDLAAAFADATTRDFAPLNAILARASDEIWGLDKTLVDWDALRVLKLANKTYLVEACQPFYATTALGAPELFHFMALPCGYAVWEEDGTVWMNVINPLVVFSTLFSDAMIDVCAVPDIDSITLCRLFMKFPLIVFNDVAAMMNGVMDEYGVADRVPRYTIGPFWTP